MVDVEPLRLLHLFISTNFEPLIEYSRSSTRYREEPSKIAKIHVNYTRYMHMYASSLIHVYLEYQIYKRVANKIGGRRVNCYASQIHANPLGYSVSRINYT